MSLSPQRVVDEYVRGSSYETRANINIILGKGTNLETAKKMRYQIKAVQSGRKGKCLHFWAFRNVRSHSRGSHERERDASSSIQLDERHSRRSSILLSVTCLKEELESQGPSFVTLWSARVGVSMSLLPNIRQQMLSASTFKP